jgi:hypothetical protein
LSCCQDAGRPAAHAVLLHHAQQLLITSARHVTCSTSCNIHLVAMVLAQSAGTSGCKQQSQNNTCTRVAQLVISHAGWLLPSSLSFLNNAVYLACLTGSSEPCIGAHHHTHPASGIRPAEALIHAREQVHKLKVTTVLCRQTKAKAKRNQDRQLVARYIK